jgi:hypothetical protein
MIWYWTEKLNIGIWRYIHKGMHHLEHGKCARAPSPPPGPGSPRKDLNLPQWVLKRTRVLTQSAFWQLNVSAVSYNCKPLLASFQIHLTINLSSAKPSSRCSGSSQWSTRLAHPLHPHPRRRVVVVVKLFIFGFGLHKIRYILYLRYYFIDWSISTVDEGCELAVAHFPRQPRPLNRPLPGFERPLFPQ